MNLNDVDWESLEKSGVFFFRDSHSSKINRYLSQKLLITSEELVIVVSAYEKFEELIRK